jgi:hypothetical protein
MVTKELGRGVHAVLGTMASMHAKSRWMFAFGSGSSTARSKVIYTRNRRNGDGGNLFGPASVVVVTLLLLAAAASAAAAAASDSHCRASLYTLFFDSTEFLLLFSLTPKTVMLIFA